MELVVTVPGATDVSHDEDVVTDAEVAEVSGLVGLFRDPSVEQ